MATVTNTTTTQSLQISCLDSGGKNVSKTFANAKTAADIDRAKLLELCESMIENTEVFKDELVRVNEVKVIGRTVEELDIA